MVVLWMISSAESDGPEKIASRAVAKFPNQFRGSPNANIAKASRWWKNRRKILDSAKPKGGISITRCSGGVRKRSFMKAGPGRGRKRAPWVLWLHEELLEEFDRLRKAGLKFSPSMLRSIALRILKESTGPFNSSYVDPRDEKPIAGKITFRWVQCFMERHSIVSRAQTGKLMVSKEKKIFLERSVAHYLGQVSRAFQKGELDENMVDNCDETHFVVNMDNGRTLGFKGDSQVKYADVVSGGEGMTMMVRITGGTGASIEPPMMIFANGNRSYPIRGIPDDVPGVSYRTQPKGWMDRKTFVEWLSNKRAISRDHLGRERVLFLDNCGGHSETPEARSALRRLNTSLRFLPPNTTDICQPADSFIISKIKDEWSRIWNEKRVN